MSLVQVLLVEDDRQISKVLSMNLSLSGYSVTLAESAEEAKAKISIGRFDILLLDVNLPDGNGIDLFHELRTQGNMSPAIFLSARVDEETIVRAMNIGADDYIRKPFGVEELKIRMTRAMKTPMPARQILEAGPISMDVAGRIASLRGQPLALSRREYDVLTILVKKSGDVVSRDAIIAFFENDREIFDRTIDSHISHLRRKLRDVAGEDVQILSIYGVGYRLQWQK